MNTTAPILNPRQHQKNSKPTYPSHTRKKRCINKDILVFPSFRRNKRRIGLHRAIYLNTASRSQKTKVAQNLDEKTATTVSTAARRPDPAAHTSTKTELACVFVRTPPHRHRTTVGLRFFDQLMNEKDVAPGAVLVRRMIRMVHDGYPFGLYHPCSRPRYETTIRR